MRSRRWRRLARARRGGAEEECRGGRSEGLSRSEGARGLSRLQAARRGCARQFLMQEPIVGRIHGKAGGRMAGILFLQRGGEWWTDLHPGGQNQLVLAPGREPGGSPWCALQRRRGCAAVRRREVDGPPPWPRRRRDASLAARRALLEAGAASLCRGVVCSSRGGARERRVAHRLRRSRVERGRRSEWWTNLHPGAARRGDARPAALPTLTPLAQDQEKNLFPRPP